MLIPCRIIILWRCLVKHWKNHRLLSLFTHKLYAILFKHSNNPTTAFVSLLALAYSLKINDRSESDWRDSDINDHPIDRIQIYSQGKNLSNLNHELPKSGASLSSKTIVVHIRSSFFSFYGRHQRWSYRLFGVDVKACWELRYSFRQRCMKNFKVYAHHREDS